MSALLTASVAFVFVFAGALLGMYVRPPDGQVQDDLKDVVRLSIGLIGTISALVLGLLIASAKSSYDARAAQIKQITVDLILLDNLLEHYGPEARNLRIALRNSVPRMIDGIWSERDNRKSMPFVVPAEAQASIDKIQELKAETEPKKALQARILGATFDLGQARLSLFAQAHDSIPMPFVAILIFWLTIIFASFGLFVRASLIVALTFMVAALSIAGAIFLILELDQPLGKGLLQISSEPMRHALAPLIE